MQQVPSTKIPAFTPQLWRSQALLPLDDGVYRELTAASRTRRDFLIRVPPPPPPRPRDRSASFTPQLERGSHLKVALPELAICRASVLCWGTQRYVGRHTQCFRF